MRKFCRPWWKRHDWNQYEMGATLADRRTLEYRRATLHVVVCDRCGKMR